MRVPGDIFLIMPRRFSDARAISGGLPRLMSRSLRQSGIPAVHCVDNPRIAGDNRKSVAGWARREAVRGVSANPCADSSSERGKAMKGCQTLLIAAALAATTGFAQEQAGLIAKVASGELKEAKASWWGFNSEDATDALQKAIRSGASRLVIENLGKPWIVRPIFLESNQTIIFEEGVIIEAKKGAFKGNSESLFSVILKENVVLRGHGATLRMHRADYDNPLLYKKAEWRHALSIRSSKNVEVHGLTLALSGGDGIYLGVSKQGVPDENIVIKDVICDRNYRQGISVIAARNLLIENTIMKDTAGTPPAAGIDFEPNAASEELVNCVMRNCLVENNDGCGYVFYLPNLNADSAPLSIRLENCVSRNGNRTDFEFITGNSEKEAVGGRIDVVNCRFEGSRGAAISIGRKPAAGAAVRFENCVVENPASKAPALVPVVIEARPGCRRPVGGVDFGELTLIDPVERDFLGYVDWVGSSGPEEIRGTFRIRRGGTETVQQLSQEWLDKKFPARMFKKIEPMPLDGVIFEPAGIHAADLQTESLPYFLRKENSLALTAMAGDTVSLSLVHSQVGNYGGDKLEIVAVSPSGKKIAAGEVPFQTTAAVGFEAPESGLYRIPVNAGANKVGVGACSHPVAVSGEDGPIHFIGAAGDLFFLVPAGTKKFGALVYGEGKGEAIKAALFDPAGNQTHEKDNIILPEMFAPDAPPAAQDQVWRLRLSSPSSGTCEDNYVDLRGVPPFLSRNPGALLKAK